MQKKYSLALWGWAARWLAHVWVLKYLEENNIEIGEISWTSMWAIIGSMYCIWKKSNEIIDFAKNINYLKLIDFDFKNWLFKWNKVYKLFEEIFWDKKIEDQNIKLIIVATDLITWKKTFFKKWKIIDALRASISLPGIFTPFEINNILYVDWWISCNLPIEALNWKNIIAVSALKKVNWPLLKTRKFLWITFNRQFFNLNYQVLHRTIVIMMKQNEIKSMETKNKNITLIEPSFWDLDYYNFNKIDDFVEIWYKEIKKIIKKQEN